MMAAWSAVSASVWTELVFALVAPMAKLRSAALTSPCKPCELKDVQHDDTASVTFTAKANSDKRNVSQIDFSTGGGSAGEKK